MISVAICIATYQRPDSLGRLLESLVHLRFQKKLEVELCVIVVDNDAIGTGREVVEHWRKELSLPLLYEIELQRGIPFVRNRLVALAGGVDFIAFIDDDEVAHPDWMDELLRVQKRYQADIVTGPVLPRFNFVPPSWIVKGRFFERPRRVTGEFLKNARTGNVLIRRMLISQIEGPFEERLALQGGTDTLMSRKLQEQLGAKIVWADEAIVEEFVPKSRATSKWLFQRAYRIGNTSALCDRFLSCSSSWILVRAFKGIGRIAQGALLLIPALFIGRVAIIQAARFICYGAGSISGIFGKHYKEYRNIHSC